MGHLHSDPASANVSRPEKTVYTNGQGTAKPEPAETSRAVAASLRSCPARRTWDRGQNP